MKGFIYKITNIINNRQYVGMSEKSWKNKLAEAMTKSSLLEQDYIKYGKSKIKVELISEINVKDSSELKESLESEFWKYLSTIEIPEYNGEEQLNRELDLRLKHLADNYYNELNIILVKSLIPKFKGTQEQDLQHWKLGFEMFVKQFQDPITDKQVLFILNNDLNTLVETYIDPIIKKEA